MAPQTVIVRTDSSAGSSAKQATDVSGNVVTGLSLDACQRTSICGAHARADKERASRARSRMGSLGLSLAAAAPTGLTESALVAAMILAAAFVALAQQTLP